MTIDEHQTKPAILEGLAMRLQIMSEYAAQDEDYEDYQRLVRWSKEVLAIQSAITQVGEEE